MSIKKGDFVTRKSYDSDLVFRVIETQFDIENNVWYAVLKGIDTRLIANAPLPDLIKVGEKEIKARKSRLFMASEKKIRQIYRQRAIDHATSGWRNKKNNLIFQEIPGSVLHLDGDEDYMCECVDYYGQMKIPITSFFISERDQPKVVRQLLEQYHPDILVLTGHDGLIASKKKKQELSNYHHSRYFVEAVKEARKFDSNKDNLIIFAGACQSCYEKLIEAGANFASAPERVFIHCFDPVLIAEKIAYTSINEIVKIDDILINTITGIRGVGGVETRGKFRLGLPKIEHRK